MSVMMGTVDKRFVYGRDGLGKYLGNVYTISTASLTQPKGVSEGCIINRECSTGTEGTSLVLRACK